MIRALSCSLAAAAVFTTLFAALTLTPAKADEQFDKDTCFKGSGDAAIAACTRRITTLSRQSGQTSKHNLAVVHYSRGYELLAKKEYQKAYDDFDTSWRTDPTFARALYSRGLAKKHLGKEADGEADIKRALEIEPDLKKYLN